MKNYPNIRKTEDYRVALVGLRMSSRFPAQDFFTLYGLFRLYRNYRLKRLR